MTISFTTGQGAAAILVALVVVAMIRCAILDFKSPAGRLFGIGVVIGVAYYLASIISWDRL